VADRRTPVLLGLVAQSVADPPPPWVRHLAPSRIVTAPWTPILEVIAMHGSTPERLELALPPLAAALASADPTAPLPALKLLTLIVFELDDCGEVGSRELDTVLSWGVLPLLCDHARSVSREARDERHLKCLRDSTHMALCILCQLLVTRPSLAAGAAAAGAVAAAATALTCVATDFRIATNGARVLCHLLGGHGRFLGDATEAERAAIRERTDWIVSTPGVLPSLAKLLAQKPPPDYRVCALPGDTGEDAAVLVTHLWAEPSKNRARRLIAAGLSDPALGGQAVSFETWEALHEQRAAAGPPGPGPDLAAAFQGLAGLMSSLGLPGQGVGSTGLGNF